MIDNLLNYIKNSYFRKRNGSFLFWIKDKIGFYPKNIEIYQTAFTHPSSSAVNNQNLEFVGDAFLDVIISEYLYNKYPNKKEGFLSQMRMKINNGENLSRISSEENLGEALIKKDGLDITDNMLEDTLEALIGAVYIDLGYKKAKQFVVNKIIDRYINFEKLEKDIFRYKSWVLEWASINKKKITSYHYKEIDSNKNINFANVVNLEGFEQVRGTGLSVKKSEEDAFGKIYKDIIKKYIDDKSVGYK